MHICADYQVNISRSKILYYGIPNWEFPETVNTGMLTCSITFLWRHNSWRPYYFTSLQTNSAYRAPYLTGVQWYFGSFFLYKYNWNYFSHLAAWFRLTLYGYIIIRLTCSCLGSALPRKLRDMTSVIKCFIYTITYKYVTCRYISIMLNMPQYT